MYEKAILNTILINISVKRRQDAAGGKQVKPASGIDNYCSKSAGRTELSFFPFINPVQIDNTVCL